MTLTVSSTQLYREQKGGGHHSFSKLCQKVQQCCCLIWWFLPRAVAISAVHRRSHMAIPAHLRLLHYILGLPCAAMTELHFCSSKQASNKTIVEHIQTLYSFFKGTLILCTQVPNLVFLAVSPEEKESWINALNGAITRAKNRILDDVSKTWPSYMFNNEKMCCHYTPKVGK